jgi:cytochrome P450
MARLLHCVRIPEPHTASNSPSQNPALQQDLFEEQSRVLDQNSGALTIASINKMTHLWASLRETLRMRPPLLTLMRKYVDDASCSGL